MDSRVFFFSSTRGRDFQASVPVPGFQFTGSNVSAGVDAHQVNNPASGASPASARAFGASSSAAALCPASSGLDRVVASVDFVATWIDSWFPNSKYGRLFKENDVSEDMLLDLLDDDLVEMGISKRLHRRRSCARLST